MEQREKRDKSARAVRLLRSPKKRPSDPSADPTTKEAKEQPTAPSKSATCAAASTPRLSLLVSKGASESPAAADPSKDIGFLAERTRAVRMLLGLALLLIVAFFVSFSLGRFHVPLWEVPRILLSRIFPLSQTWTDDMARTVINIRLPRILLACLVGCSLSAAGASYQGVFQNPMASPDILGAAGGAAFGAALAILFGASGAQITLAAFFMGLAAVGLVFLIAQRAPGSSVINLVLAGMMISSLMSAGTSCVKLVADPNNQLPQITYWLMGSLADAKLERLGFAFFPMLIGLTPLLLLRWRIDLLSLGDEEARTLGVNTQLLRLIVILCSTLITAASVAVSGMIGWVGLVIPHLCRKLVGSSFRRLLPASCLAGASFLLLVDDVARCLLTAEIPIGILTAFIGAPFFIYLILRREKTL